MMTFVGKREMRDACNAVERLRDVRRVVGEQAKDEALWFHAQTAPEAYLQAALRRLHAAIEHGEARLDMVE